MGRFRDSGTEEGNEGGIDLSPMIDCVFILLIFFIVTTTFVEETGVEVDKPQAASAVRMEKSSILLALTKDGEVIYGGQSIGVAGVRPLIKRLIQKEMAPVVIQADEVAQTGLLMRVIDEAKLGGAQIVNLAAGKGQG